ncbi:hypothetical protein [Roseococcus suduntuyensis]|uniref:OmpA family protein n=1 Tax=Roseococcus suduntuyensis TaxID=455361 RepID=A0A840AD80_9PROT|nr:hypothetical protein [Roseococcus suduntuyensis]MBB3898882.1 hypothetical protein [Roseococcus suduntuyensis]
MRARRALLAAMAGLLARPAGAQPNPSLPDPALAPPPPVRLPTSPPPAAPLPLARPVAIGGLLSMNGGGWRLAFEPGTESPTAAQRLGLLRLGGHLARETTGRITLWAEAAGNEDVSTTRRLSLRRGLAVRAGLVAGGLPETRVDIRALGRVEAGQDLVDILPMGATRG